MKMTVWRGGSNRLYPFEVFPITQKFTDDMIGNYIFALEWFGGWDAVYIGQGKIQKRLHDEDHRRRALDKGASHIHIHFNPDEEKRKEEETDLLDGNTEAYHPYGCNKKIGG